MVLSLRKNQIVRFRGKDKKIREGRWIGIHKFTYDGALLKISDLKNKNKKYIVPDNLLIKPRKRRRR